MCWLSGDHAESTKHRNVFCSRRRISDEGDAEEWVACDRRNENIPLALSTTISPTSTTPERAASCTFPCLRINGLAKCFFSTRANRSRLILSSVSVGSDGSRSTISMPGSCSSGCSWRECSKLLMYAYWDSPFGHQRIEIETKLQKAALPEIGVGPRGCD